MILILASWVFILAICYLFGFGINYKLFKQNTISETIIIGIIVISFLSNLKTGDCWSIVELGPKTLPNLCQTVYFSSAILFFKIVHFIIF
jgi:hypothetical protein